MGEIIWYIIIFLVIKNLFSGESSEETSGGGKVGETVKKTTFFEDLARRIAEAEQATRNIDTATAPLEKQGVYSEDSAEDSAEDYVDFSERLTSRDGDFHDRLPEEVRTDSQAVPASRDAMVFRKRPDRDRLRHGVLCRLFPGGLGVSDMRRGIILSEILKKPDYSKYSRERKNG